LLCEMMFSKFFTQSVHLGGIRGHNPPKDGVLLHFQLEELTKYCFNSVNVDHKYYTVSQKKTVVSPRRATYPVW